MFGRTGVDTRSKPFIDLALQPGGFFDFGTVSLGELAEIGVDTGERAVGDTPPCPIDIIISQGNAQAGHVDQDKGSAANVKMLPTGVERYFVGAVACRYVPTTSPLPSTCPCIARSNVSRSLPGRMSSVLSSAKSWTW